MNIHAAAIREAAAARYTLTWGRPPRAQAYTMASYNAVPESEQLLNKTPKTKSWTRIAAAAAAA